MRPSIMSGGHQGDRSVSSGAASRAWLAALLVWSFVFQLLVPAIGPMRLGDGTAMAALGRIMPICTIEGLRLAEPAAADRDGGNDAAPVDAGWHCVLCITPATGPVEADGGPGAPAGWRFSWTTPSPGQAPAGRPHSPQSARGPPPNS